MPERSRVRLPEDSDQTCSENDTDFSDASSVVNSLEILPISSVTEVSSVTPPPSIRNEIADVVTQNPLAFARTSPDSTLAVGLQEGISQSEMARFP